MRAIGSCRMGWHDPMALATRRELGLPNASLPAPGIVGGRPRGGRPGTAMMAREPTRSGTWPAGSRSVIRPLAAEDELAGMLPFAPIRRCIQEMTLMIKYIPLESLGKNVVPLASVIFQSIRQDPGRLGAVSGTLICTL